MIPVRLSMENASNQSLPAFVMLELTNACDLACRHCPFHGDGVEKLRGVGQMPKPVWQAAIAEILAWDSPVCVQPWGMGEPILSPDLWDVVRAAKQGPKVTVGFYSNANSWSEADIDAAFESGLDWVTFSIDGVRKEVFEHYRVGAELDRVIATLRRLGERRARLARSKPEIRVNMVQYKELEDHGDEFVAAMRGLADTVMVSRFREVGNRTFSPIQLPRIPCYQLDTMFALLWDGRVAQCCEDQQGQDPLGYFPAQSMRQIWHGPRLTELRAAHQLGRYGASPLCQDCDAWTGIYERHSERADVRIREKTATTVFDFVKQSKSTNHDERSYRD